MRRQPSPADGLLQPHDLARLHGRFAPWPLMLIIIGSIFLAEVVAMLVVRLLPALPYVATIMIDAGIMVLLIFPILHFLSYRPLVQFIASLQQAERTLQQKDELQERFFRSMDVMIAYMDREFNFIKVNEAYAKSSEGWTPENFVGRNHFKLFPHPENQVIFQKVVDTGEPYVAHEKPFEYPDQPERGVTYWNWSLQPVKSPQGGVEGVVLSLVDVTERKRAEQKVEHERARMRSILDTMPDGVYIVNERHQIEYANPVIEREFGPAGTRTCYQHFYDRSEPCAECRNESIFSGQVLQREWTSLRTGKVYETFDSPLPNSDGSLSKLKVIHDITVRKQAESELERRNLELQTLSASEHRQRQVAETLRLAAQGLTQSLDLDTVLHAVLRNLRLLTQADTASVFLPEGDTLLGIRAVDGYENLADPTQLVSLKVDTETHPIFARVLSTRTTILIADTEREPDWVVFPGNEPVHSRLYAPVVVEDKVIAIVGLGKPEPDYFTEEHLRLVEALVGQAGVAIQNAWLFEQVRAGRERLQTLSRRLVEVQEKERLYIARELHDQASQTLTSLTLGLGALEGDAMASPGIRGKAADLKRMTNQVLEELHHLAINLRPASLDHVGLTPALQQFIRAYSQDTSLNMRLKTVGLEEDERLAPDVETTLYRIVQEAVTNAVRHASASRVDVMLERRGDSVVLIVEDDGRGFDPAVPAGGGHLGLIGMQERAEMLGGTLTVESMPGKGTTIFAEVPYDNTHPDRR